MCGLWTRPAPLTARSLWEERGSRSAQAGVAAIPQPGWRADCSAGPPGGRAQDALKGGDTTWVSPQRTCRVKSKRRRTQDSTEKLMGCCRGGGTDMGLERWGVYDALGSPECPPGSPSHGRGLRQAARTAASLCSFGLHFSAAGGTEHLFMCLLIIYVPLLGKRLFEAFAPF